MVVLADESQLEEALLTVILHAELAAASSSRRILRATSRIIGRKVVISLDVSRPVVKAEDSELSEGTGCLSPASSSRATAAMCGR